MNINCLPFHLCFRKRLEHETKNTVCGTDSSEYVETRRELVGIQQTDKWYDFKYIMSNVCRFLLVCEGSHDGRPDPRPADGDASDHGPLLVEVLRDAVQPGQVDDAQPQAHEAAGREVEEDHAGGEGGETEAGRGEDRAHHRGQSPAQSVGHVGRHWP